MSQMLTHFIFNLLNKVLAWGHPVATIGIWSVWRERNWIEFHFPG